MNRTKPITCASQKKNMKYFAGSHLKSASRYPNIFAKNFLKKPRRNSGALLSALQRRGSAGMKKHLRKGLTA
jgi:hypothetical protein